MSYAVAPGPGPKVRPGTVSTASMLIYLAAVLLLIIAAVSFVPFSEIQKIVDELYADDPQTQQAAGVGATIGLVVTAIVYVLIAAGLVFLGVFVGKGKQPARIITWVVCGLAVLCLGCGLASSAISNSLTGLGGDPQSAEMVERIAAATPGWVTAVSLALQIVVLIAMIAVIILLALPASNDYFRKEQQVWVPPTTWPGPGDSTLPPPPPPAPTQ